MADTTSISFSGPSPEERKILEQRDAEITRAEQGIMGEQQTLAGRQKQSDIAREAATAPMEKAALGDLAGVEALSARPRPHVEYPTYAPQPAVDAKQFQNLSWALLGMALVGGVASKDWLSASTTLNGALQGYMQGNQAVAQQRYQDYTTKFNEAKAKEEQANKEYEDVITDKKLSLNARMNALRILDAKYDRQDARFARESGRLDALLNHYDARRQMLANLNGRFALVHDQLSRTMGPVFDPATARRLAEQYIAGNKQVITSAVRGKNAQGAMMQLQDEITKVMQEQGKTPEDINAATADLAALGATLRQTYQRQAGIERLTGAIQTMESKVTQLAKQVVPTGYPILNVRVNDIRTKLGSGAVVELRNLMLATARQYIEAVTMPGSNAQLHASSQETADEMINSNMSVEQIQGAFEAMNAEIAGTTSALSATSQRLLDRIAHRYGAQDIRPEFRPGAAAAPAAGPSDADTDALINKWKTK